MPTLLLAFATTCICWGAATAVPAAQPDLVGARALLLGGRYAEAAEIYAKRADKDPAAALGLARCLAAQGRLNEAAAKLEPLAKDQPGLQAELAELAFRRGDNQTARARATAALKLDRLNLRARWIAAELARVEGRLAEANNGYRWFVRHYNGQDVDDAESLHLIGLAAARHARWNRLADQFDFLVNDLYPAALAADPKYWPAHYEAGLLFLEKHNEADAADELRKALELNPAAAEVHAALARLALENRDIERARASAERALEINPRLLAAWHVRADMLWANFQPRAAMALLKEKAVPLCPTSEETLGRLAACYMLVDGLQGDNDDSRFAKLAAEVTRRNPHAGDFFFTMAELLESRSKIAPAELMFREALKRMPQKIGPRSGLGMLYMRTGDEARARRLLDEAFEVDPFNVRVSNMLGVLDVLDGMGVVETEHVLLRYSRAEDQLLAEYAARELDEIYPRLCRQFGYRPPGKPVIEIFNRAEGADGHEWFSTRLIGLPYVGTVAASTGRIVAMVSPNEPDLGSRYNWRRVMTHELVHVITLQQTDFNCPHWLTEALAVWCENVPRPQEWNEVLVRRTAQKRLFDLGTLNFGFIRPHSSDDWTLAYCQAELYLEYMLRNHGAGVVRRLLAAYAANLTTPQAIEQAMGVSQQKFERGYRRFVERLVAEMASLAESAEEEDIAVLRARQQAAPDNADLAARLARAYVRRKADAEASRLALLAVKLKPRHPLATYVLARLRLNAGDPGAAIEMLADCLDEEHPQRNALNLLAGLQLKAERYDEAARLYALGQKHDPYNLKWSRALARVYMASGNDERLSAVLAKLARADPDDLTVRKKLAKLALARKDFEAAVDWCRQALYIDVKDADAHRTLGEALVARNDLAEAIDHYEKAIEFDPKEPQQRFALADAYLQTGQPEKARRTLERLLRLVPDYPGAELLLESLGKKAGDSDRRKE